MALTTQYTYLTHDIPGIGGILRERPEDFLVEEQPYSDLTGSGDYLYLFIEKTKKTTNDLIRMLSKAFRVSANNIGYAGMKDKHAITRQHVSLLMPEAHFDKAAESDGVRRLEYNPAVKILWADRHNKPLHHGQHGGNRFSIRIRQVNAATALTAKQVLDRLELSGIPNYFGDQRFGYRQNSHLLGKYLLKGEYEPFLEAFLGPNETAPADIPQLAKGRELFSQGKYEEALEVWPRNLRHDRQALDALRQGKNPVQTVSSITKNQREFLANACQSYVFNRIVEERVKRGWFDRLVQGDVGFIHDIRDTFPVTEDDAEAERVKQLEVSPSGPMWGDGMTLPTGDVLTMEEQALHDFDLTAEDMKGPDDRHAVKALGSRRPIRVKLRDPDISGGADEHGPYVKANFELPRGAFATMVLREIMKTDLHRPTARQDNSSEPQNKM